MGKFSKIFKGLTGLLTDMIKGTDFYKGFDEAGGIDGITIYARGGSASDVKGYKSARDRYNELIAKLDKIELEVVSNISINELNKRQDIRRRAIAALIKSIIGYKDKALFTYNELAEILNLSHYGKKSLKEDIMDIKKSINKKQKIMELIKKYSI